MSGMYEFHALLRPRNSSIAEGPILTIRGHSLATLQLAQPNSPFQLSFDDAVGELLGIERLFTEPDGAFVCSSDPLGEWQLEGTLCEHDDRLLYVEAWGRCPFVVFDQLLACFGWPTTGIIFECVQEGVLLAEADFRRFADKS
ncbi:MAG TPA: hypothetical protein VMX74_14910 [Pirellulales bacterium]|nr:hypothetical protein [Pirellulales bacterium]